MDRKELVEKTQQIKEIQIDVISNIKFSESSEIVNRFEISLNFINEILNILESEDSIEPKPSEEGSDSTES